MFGRELPCRHARIIQLPGEQVHKFQIGCDGGRQSGGVCSAHNRLGTYYSSANAQGAFDILTDNILPREGMSEDKIDRLRQEWNDLFQDITGDEKWNVQSKFVREIYTKLMLAEIKIQTCRVK